MSNLTWLAIAIIGSWYFQDALASIAYYPKENWKWNHAARAIRAGLALALIIIAIEEIA